MYRSAQESLEERERSKLLERETWFLPRIHEAEQAKEPESRKMLRGRRRFPKKQNSKDEKPSQIKAVMFVPFTVGSKLAKELRESENLLSKSTGANVNIVEALEVHNYIKNTLKIND